jgi:hypothetical protein
VGNWKTYNETLTTHHAFTTYLIPINNILTTQVGNCKTYNETRDRSLVSDVIAVEKVCLKKLEESKSTITEAEAMIKLSERLADATKQLMLPEFREFHNPLNQKEYTAVVKKPIDLTTIHTKATAFAYSSRGGWLEDLKLLRDNCHLYCESRHPNLPPLSDKLLAQGQKFLQVNNDAINALEEGVGTWAHHSKAATPGTSYPGTPGLGRSVPASPGGGNAGRSPAMAADEDEDLAADLAAGMEEADDGDAGALENELENAMEVDCCACALLCAHLCPGVYICMFVCARVKELADVTVADALRRAQPARVLSGGRWRGNWR